MMVEMGTDRLHHGFWRYYDHGHPDYVPGTAYEQAFRDYYRYLDSEIGSLIEGLGSDTALMVLSDHGAQSMFGGIRVNEWLIREGYLTLREGAPAGPVKPDMIDWARTRVWGDGGYYSRIFLNVRGREPEGVVEPSQVEPLRDELIARLEALGDEQGNSIGTKAFRPEQLYHAVNGVPPDLIVYFGNLTWRSIGTRRRRRHPHPRERHRPRRRQPREVRHLHLRGPGHAGGCAAGGSPVRHRTHACWS